MTDSLYCVCVEQDALLPADRAQFRDRLDRPDLIICVHDRHKAGVVPDRRFQLFGAHQAVLVNVQKGDRKSLFLQFLERMKYCVVFKSCGDDVGLSLFLSDLRSRSDRLVVRLTPAGCEEDLRRFRPDHRRDLLSGLLQDLLRLLSERVKAGGIAVLFLQTRDHGVYCRAAHFRRSRIVCVYHHFRKLLS